jgi:Protein of unknown function (DUF2786)
MNLDDTRRKELLGRLDGLRNMTVENGCSENEAAIAARKAARLMDEYGLTLEELRALKPDDAIQVEYTWNDNGGAWSHGSSKKRHPVAFVANRIGILTGVDIISNKEGSRHGYAFVGAESDIAIAKFLIELFKTSMEVEWARYWKVERELTDASGLSVRPLFMRGMVARLNERVQEIIDQRKQDDNSCTALVSLKNQLVTAKVAKEFGKMRVTKMAQPNIFVDSAAHHYNAGKEAANNVSISAGLIE